MATNPRQPGSFPDAVPPAIPIAACDLAMTLRGLGLSGPVLVVASNESVSQQAPAWAESFAVVAWAHRVRVCGPLPAAAEAEALAAEAARLQARLIMVVGDEPVMAAARRAATDTGLPLVAWTAAGGAVVIVAGGATG
ncbi:MAG: hypothetical protein DWH79_05365 [Planctomycetota bacterium]|nr:MAG: hypothetical protein DWH79_05365 [Planctomycetota bacterium]